MQVCAYFRRLLIQFLYIIPLIFFSEAHAQSNDSVCNANLSPLHKTVSSHSSEDLPIKSIGIQFHSTQIVHVVGNQEIAENIVSPKMVLEVAADQIVGNVISELKGALPNKIKSPIGKVDIVKSSLKVKSVSVVSKKKVKISGTIRLEQWASMTGFKCDWLKCKKTTWKTRTWRETVRWSANANLTPKIIVPSEAVNPQGLPIASDQLGVPVTMSTIQWSSKSKKPSNDLVKAVINTIGTLVSVFDDDVDTWNAANQLGVNLGSGDKQFDVRKQLYPNNSLAEIEASASGPTVLKGRGKWQIFVDSLAYDRQNSGFAKNNGKLSINLNYDFDYKLFNNLMRNTDVGINPFNRSFFCASNKTRVELEDYLNKIVAQIEDGPGEQYSIVVSSLSEVKSYLKETYGTHRAYNYFRKKDLVQKIENGYSISPLDLKALADSPSIILAWGNLSTFADYFELSQSELNCIYSLSSKRNGSPDLVYAFDDLTECINSDEELSEEQNKILDEIDDEEKFAGMVAQENFGSPVTNPTYRGWYYCYRNSTICVGKNNISWWQKPSEFKSRGGRHKGLDLFGDDKLGASNLYAVGNGKLVFSDRDKRGWGNALLLPVNHDGNLHYIVYAHLPDSAKLMNNKKVTKGDSLGFSDCSGNAGNGKGECNSYCEYAGSKRTDNHLHIEVIKVDDGKRIKIDPIKFLNLKVSTNKKRFRVRCD